MNKIAVVVLNWNGKESLAACLESLLVQSMPATVIVVDNGSTDGSLEFLNSNYPQVDVVVNKKNLGFAGGVNSGIARAQELAVDYLALLNNDATAEQDWLAGLVDCLNSNSRVGIATCKLLDAKGEHIDSTGDYYTNWGLPYPRGRGEDDLTKYDHLTSVFAASGGASLFRMSMLQQIGLFDQDFFAYYEDVDISFRAQLAGWKIAYVPSAVVYHQIGATSSKIKGFTTYQTIKNLPWLLIKNVPRKYLWRVLWRFKLAYLLFLVSAVVRGQGWVAIKGLVVSLALTPKKLVERRRLQKSRKVSADYIWGIMVHDLPPNATRLRQLRLVFWKLVGKKS
ncbi:MAG TPA: glycosyltransferase family 2 protein [Candidatus Dormibacteraeota bacterium]|nr:glycosyltransferase family 2 protein [Candidatus Dormibacteraeota bacterium]